MLNKVKYGGLVAGIIMVIRWIAPDVEIPEGLQDAIMLIIVFSLQWLVKENGRTVSRLKFGKGGRSALGVAILAPFLLLGSQPAQAQSIQSDISLGAGSVFGEEDITFDRDALFVAIHWSGVELPMNTGSGLGIEFSFPEYPDARAVYSLWSLNRVKVTDGFYTGTDMRITRETDPDFAIRLVVGARLKLPSSESRISIEIYSLEDGRPIYFAVLYNF